MTGVELVYRAILDLHDRDKNNGDWPDGIPVSFQTLAGVLKIEGGPEEWVLAVEQYVRRRATEFMAGKIRAEEWEKSV